MESKIYYILFTKSFTALYTLLVAVIYVNEVALTITLLFCYLTLLPMCGM